MVDRTTPDWFYRAISSGLAALLVLHLPGTPAHDVISLTEEVWVRALWSADVAWREDLDAPRIDDAFLRMTRQVDRWPAPRLLLELMPARPAPLQLVAPSLSAAERAHGRAKLRAMIEKMNAKRA